MHNSLTLKRQGYLLTNKYIHYICADKINAMIKTNLFLLLFVLLAGTSCNRQQHFISDDTFRAEVENDFRAKQAALPDGNLFSVFNQKMTSDEKEALTFLYAYMPIGDITDYDGQLYLDNIRSSFRARVEMPWGDSIPEDIFRHFVLPVRVNNENLDESRMVFYEELKDRVKGLSLYDAVLEVNHWCHEKVIYTPSDARTSSPLASVKTAYGRCGEESTFTVAALRSVGIPARQVYTPRWAHTDDNHAWVEAWVNGKWYFLGACEPEPVLNLGWFNGPAYRGMLMHTKVFGKYNGPEEVMDVTDGYTEINVIDNYAPTAKATITIVDENGQPVCILSALPQLEEPDPTPAPEENGTDNTNSGTRSNESSGENPASNAKDWGSSLWDDEEDSEKSELGDANAGEESAIPTEKVELDMTAASPEP